MYLYVLNIYERTHISIGPEQIYTVLINSKFMSFSLATRRKVCCAPEQCLKIKKKACQFQVSVNVVHL